MTFDKKKPSETADLSALDAISAAQQLAFGPMLFHAAGCLRDMGVLAFLEERKTAGVLVEDVARGCGLSVYGAGVLLEAGVVGRLVREADGRFFLGRAGHFFLHDQMTRVNFDFVRDVCYAGMAHLRESVENGKPEGLKVFGDWPTIYPALSALPEPAKGSWFAFDHFYSDAAFGAALSEVFQLAPKEIYDVGGNTGKWALRCVAYDSQVEVTVLDLPEQVALLRGNVRGKPGAERIKARGVNMLAEEDLPGGADVWWMSQFLDCFAAEEIVGILGRIRAAMKPGARVCILEPFCDRQSFAAGELSLAAGSLYFTCLANGNSRFYRADAFIALVEKAGLRVEREVNRLGVGEHTLLVCVAG